MTRLMKKLYLNFFWGLYLIFGEKHFGSIMKNVQFINVCRYVGSHV